MEGMVPVASFIQLCNIGMGHSDFPCHKNCVVRDFLSKYIDVIFSSALINYSGNVSRVGDFICYDGVRSGQFTPQVLWNMLSVKPMNT